MTSQTKLNRTPEALALWGCKPIVGICALALTFLLPSGAHAGTITVFDTTETLTFNISADIASRVTGGLAGGAFCIAEMCSFIIAPPPGAGASYSARTNIFGPDGPLSDTFQFLNGNPTFQSDSESGPPLVPFPTPFNSLVEDGTILMVGQMSFNVNGTTVETNTMFLQSDGTPEAPEPAGLALVGGGLIALGLFRRKRVSSHSRA